MVYQSLSSEFSLCLSQLFISLFQTISFEFYREVKKVTEEDNLYKIPEHIKVSTVVDLTSYALNNITYILSNFRCVQVENIQATKDAVKAEDNGIVPAWSTQLAEVALPISFKMRNIEATERIATKAGENMGQRPGGGSNIASMYRFNTQERAAKLHPSMTGFDASSAPGGAPSSSADGNKGGQKRPMKSSDDYALEQYKKVSTCFHLKHFLVIFCCIAFYPFTIYCIYLILYKKILLIFISAASKS